MLRVVLHTTSLHLFNCVHGFRDYKSVKSALVVTQRSRVPVTYMEQTHQTKSCDSNDIKVDTTIIVYTFVINIQLFIHHSNKIKITSNIVYNVNISTQAELTNVDCNRKRYFNYYSSGDFLRKNCLICSD